MKSLLFSTVIGLIAWNSIFVSPQAFAKSEKAPKCIIALELNDMDFNETNRHALKTTLREMNVQPTEFFIDNKEQLSPSSRSLSAVRLLDYGPRPGINEEARYVGQKQISLVVPKSIYISGSEPSKVIYSIQVYSLKNVTWNVTTDSEGNQQAHFHGEIEKVSPTVEIGQRLVSVVDKIPPICDALGKSKMDLIDSRICSREKVEEPLTDESVIKKQIQDYVKTCN